MAFDPYETKKIQLKSYLREFFVTPDMAPPVWKVANFCMNHPSHGMFGFKFQDQLSMRQFALACLLSCGHHLTWLSVGSYKLIQDNLANTFLLTEFQDYDVVFIPHEVGTMKNSMMGQMISQVGVLRGSKKTFFFDLGGHKITYLSYRISTVSEAFAALGQGAGPAPGSTSGVVPSVRGEFDDL
jgi:hypothetical protein